MVKSINKILIIAIIGIFAISISNKTKVSINSKIYYEDNQNDIKVEKIYVDESEVSKLPTKGGNIEFEKAICENATASWNNDNWSLVFDSISGKVKCSVYFKTKEETSEEESSSEKSSSNDSNDSKSDSKSKKEEKKLKNPDTGVFFNIILAITILGLLGYGIYYAIKRKKFYKL